MVYMWKLINLVTLEMFRFNNFQIKFKFLFTRKTITDGLG